MLKLFRKKRRKKSKEVSPVSAPQKLLYLKRDQSNLQLIPLRYPPQLTEFTLEISLLPVRLDSVQTLLLLAGKGESTPVLTIKLNEEAEILLQFGTTNWIVPSQAQLHVGDWSQLSLSWSAAQETATLFLDDLLLGTLWTEDRPFSPPKEPLFFLGSNLEGTEGFEGALSEFRFWEQGHLESEIREHCARPIQGSEEGLLYYFPLREGEGNQLKNLGPSPSQGQVLGGEWRELELPFDFTFGSCLRLAKGVESWVYRKNLNQFPTTEITVEFWLRSSDLERQGTPFSYGVSEHQFNTFTIFNINSLELYICDQVLKVGLSMADGRWHHLAVSWSSEKGATVVYLDGKIRFQGTVAEGATLPSGGVWYLGQEQDGYGALNFNYGLDKKESFHGELAEVRIWDQVRSPEEIQRGRYHHFQGDQENLIGYWPLDEGVGAVAEDWSPSKQDGKIGGCEWIESDLYLRTWSEEQLFQAFCERDLANQKISGLKAAYDALEERSKQERQRIENAQATRLLRMEESLAALEKQVQEAAQEKERQRLETEEALQEQERRYNEQMTLLEGKNAQTSMADLIRNTQAQIAAAKEQLAQQKATHSLQNVTMELRMIPSPSGTGMSFPTVSQMERLGQNQLSVINLEFSSTEKPKAEKPAEMQLPSVIGYTEIMALRKLGEQGFPVEVNAQAVREVPGQPSMADRVVTQYPKPGSLVAPQSTVVLFIGKPIQE